MALEITSTGAALGAVVSQLDLTQPLETETVERLRNAWLDHIVLVYHGQDLSDLQLLNFTRYFGELEYPPSKLLNYSQGSGQKAGIPLEINVISNVVENGKKIGQLGHAEAKWHTDTPFVERPPAASVLHALEIPPTGGNTSFMNMYAVLEALPTSLLAKIEGKKCKHDVSHTSDGVLRHDFGESATAKECPGPWHPMVRTHPDSGRKALYLGKRAWAYIEGTATEENEEILDAIWAFAERPEFVYEHVWTQGDVVMWDNRCAMHRREEFDDSERRIMHRSQLCGDIPV